MATAEKGCKLACLNGADANCANCVGPDKIIASRHDDDALAGWYCWQRIAAGGILSRLIYFKDPSLYLPCCGIPPIECLVCSTTLPPENML